jgi:hypothetical protein
MPCHLGFGAGQTHSALRALGLCRSHSLGEPEIKVNTKVEKLTIISYKIYLCFYYYFEESTKTRHLITVNKVGHFPTLDELEKGMHG